VRCSFEFAEVVPRSLPSRVALSAQLAGVAAIQCSFPLAAMKGISRRRCERAGKSTAHNALISRKIQRIRERRDVTAVPCSNLPAVGADTIENFGDGAGRAL